MYATRTYFCNILFYQDGKSPEQNISITVYLYYLTHSVNFACQKKKEYPEKPTMFSKSLARKYSFHMNMVQITLRPQSNHTQRTVLGSYFMVLPKLIAR